MKDIVTKRKRKEKIEIGMRDKNRERCTQREIEKQGKRDEREAVVRFIFLKRSFQ
jgi:hypothetical protein